jgi:NTP pyrophosphatase (non-canonical NTP hydrolase)
VNPAADWATYQDWVETKLPSDVREAQLSCALGVAGEAGEVADLLKKYHFHGRPLDAVRLGLELGDVLFYVTALAELHGLTLEAIAEANVAKLNARYPDGFSTAAAALRADEARQLPMPWGEDL